MSAKVVVDASGGQSGGAARFRTQLMRYLRGTESTHVEVLRPEERITSSWLAVRERISPDCPRIALNNYSFTLGRGTRTVLLRNPLDFLVPEDRQHLPQLPRHFSSQARLVRAMAHRAHRIVVPSEGMARRVGRVAPKLSDRVVVRYHPLSMPAHDPSVLVPDSKYIYLPGLIAPHKDLRGAAVDMLQALERADSQFELVMTVRNDDIDLVDQRLRCVGPLELNVAVEYLRSATAAFLPTTVESFAYPLAEARSLGVPVIVPQTAETLDVAGKAAVTYRLGDPESLTNAIGSLESYRVTPDPSPFDPMAYFDWLLGGVHEG